MSSASENPSSPYSEDGEQYTPPKSATKPSITVAGATSKTPEHPNTRTALPASRHNDETSSTSNVPPTPMSNLKRPNKNVKILLDDDPLGTKTPPDTPVSKLPPSQTREGTASADCIRLEVCVRDLIDDLGLLKGAFLNYATPTDDNHRAVSEAGYDCLGPLFLLEDEVKDLVRRVQDREEEDLDTGNDLSEVSTAIDKEFEKLEGRFRDSVTDITALRIKLEKANAKVTGQDVKFRYRLIGNSTKASNPPARVTRRTAGTSSPRPAQMPTAGRESRAKLGGFAKKRRSEGEIDREIATKRAKMQELEEDIYSLRREKESMVEEL